MPVSPVVGDRPRTTARPVMSLVRRVFLPVPCRTRATGPLSRRRQRLPGQCQASQQRRSRRRLHCRSVRPLQWLVQFVHRRRAEPGRLRTCRRPGVSARQVACRREGASSFSLLSRLRPNDHNTGTLRSSLAVQNFYDSWCSMFCMSWTRSTSRLLGPKVVRNANSHRKCNGSSPEDFGGSPIV